MGNKGHFEGAGKLIQELNRNPKIRLLGIECGSNGSSIDGDGDVDIIDFGEEHSEWWEWDERSGNMEGTAYLDNTGWSVGLWRDVVPSPDDVDLEEWEEKYDLSYNGEAESRYVLAEHLDKNVRFLIGIYGIDCGPYGRDVHETVKCAGFNIEVIHLPSTAPEDRISLSDFID